MRNDIKTLIYPFWPDAPFSFGILYKEAINLPAQAKRWGMQIIEILGVWKNFGYKSKFLLEVELVKVG